MSDPIQILKSSEIPLYVPTDRQNNVRALIYNPQTSRTEAIALDDLLGLADANARTLKIVSASTYSILPSDSDKILFFTFDEGDVTVTLTDGLSEQNYGEFLLVCGDATALVVVGDGVDVRKSRSITNRLPNWGIGRIRLCSLDTVEVGPFATGFFLEGGFELALAALPATEVIMEWAAAGVYTGIVRPDPGAYPYCDALLIAAGGGGGAGRRGATTEICRGGGGGAGGSVVQITLDTASLGSTFSVIVGTGGAGAPAVTTNATNGANGTAGGATDLTPVTGSLSPSSRIRAPGGSAGSGGTLVAGAGGSATLTASGPVGVLDGAGAESVAGSNGRAATTVGLRPAGGGGGGSLAANLTTEFSGGSSTAALHLSTAGGNPAGTINGSNAASSGELIGDYAVCGGGGGASKSSGAAGSGGNGTRGSGGGGGGASRDGSNSGAGGRGGDGYVRLRFYR